MVSEEINSPARKRARDSVNVRVYNLSPDLSAHNHDMASMRPGVGRENPSTGPESPRINNPHYDDRDSPTSGTVQGSDMYDLVNRTDISIPRSSQRTDEIPQQWDSCGLAKESPFDKTNKYGLHIDDTNTAVISHRGFEFDNRKVDSSDQMSIVGESATDIVSLEGESKPLSTAVPTSSANAPFNDNAYLSSDDDAFFATVDLKSFHPHLQADPSFCVSSKAAEVEEKSSDEDPEFSDDLDIAVLKTLVAPTQLNDKENSFGAKISYSRPEFSRYEVQSVFASSYQMEGSERTQLVLTVKDKKDDTFELIVRGISADLDIKASDIVHVIRTDTGSPHLVSDSHNLLVWHPDTLVSSTVVADQLECPRRTVLKKRLTFPRSYSIPLLTGMIIHELFQHCLVTGQSTLLFVEHVLEQQIQKHLPDIYTLGDVVDELQDKIRPHIPYIVEWFQKFWRTEPSEIPTNKRHHKAMFSVAAALHVEEKIWSPMFGIKGIADVTLHASLGDVGDVLLPMEIKTGQPYPRDQLQAALYSLLYKDRYEKNISSFLLVYTSDEGSTTKHKISDSELRSLVNLRNVISIYLQPGKRHLPALMRQQKCDRCIIQKPCMTYNYLTENGTSEESGLNDGVFEDLTAHLKSNDRYKEFLSHWDFLLSKEEEFASRFDKELWVYTAKEREQSSGKSLASLIISDRQKTMNDYIYTFKRKSDQCDKSFSDCQISKDDRVMISDELGHFALGGGDVRHIDEESIIIACIRPIVSTSLESEYRRGSQEIITTVFRVDKDEFSYGMGVARYNVLNLFLKDGDHVRRSLIVDGQSPTFDSSLHFQIDGTRFNDCQIKALEMVSKMNDYCLILGMPGTGKTTVIAHLIKMLVAAKKTVLLTSFTHSAVDNILLKVKDKVDILRIGKTSRIHPSIRQYSPSKIECYSDFQKVYLKPYVVATTCLSIQDASFNIRDRFDYCIVDEASQVSMPVILGPLALCDKFVLVGDHHQLPPLVSHPDSDVKAGLSKSLFQILATSHPESVVELKQQYRMSEDIMSICNKLFYDNRLKCGNEKVSCQVLKLNHVDVGMKWLDPVLEEKNRVLFFDHDLISGYERSIGDNITNPTEVELVRQTVEALCSCGVDPGQIGVMTFYRSQLKLLSETFRHLPELEILTADRFQGRDKDCIIISMVRSNGDKKTGELLKDWRRLNVAVTRARAKLIVFGSVSTLSNAQFVCDFIDLAKSNRWIHELTEPVIEFGKNPVSSSSGVSVVTKVSERSIQRHTLVKNILADMK